VAGDLIPPPSPAGKPPPDPTVEPSAQVEAAAQLDAAPESAQRTPAPFRGRFGFVWGALAGIAVCAVGTFALLIASPNETGPMLAADWSPWEPGSTKMVEGAREIADHVGVQYKLDGGEQLVSVRSSELELGGQPIGVAVRPTGGELHFLEGDGLLYILNGLGPNGRLSTGKPTKERGRLLMREALELALYSFRYLDDVTMVAVLMPQTAEQSESNAGGAAAAPQTNAIFYRPGDLLEQLRVPLDRTLSPSTPRPSTMTKTEATRVDDLTLRNLFLASVQPLQSDRNYLVLVEPETVE
jgi:hypothetical protein